MKEKASKGLAALALVVCGLLVCAGASFAQAPAVGNAPPAEAQAAQGQKPPAKPGEPKPFDEVVKDMSKMEGLFTFYWDADENKLLMEIQPEQLDKLYLVSPTTARSVGERGFWSSQMAGMAPVYFRKIGNRIQMVEKNTRFTANKGTPEARANELSFPDSILGSGKIQAKPHPERKSYLIDVGEYLLTDLPGWAPALSEAYRPTQYRFDKNDSFFGKVKVFPKNVLIEVTHHYVTANPQAPSATMPDSRSVPIVMIYDISELKETGYQARTADDRVGYFLTLMQDFSADDPTEPYLRYINRWHLEKKDPSAAVSEPKEPIVYWLENTIPLEYRDAFREGALMYNRAFEKAGFKNAIVVKQMPDDADWDPADTRYNVIRWFAGVGASFAIGPSRRNPFTGEIYDADIGFSEGIIRSGKRAGRTLVYPVTRELEGGERQVVPRLFQRIGYEPACTYAADLAEQAEFGLDVLEARGMLSPEQEKEFMRQFIAEVTAHEVGHTLGLRHNFRASTMLDANQLNDTGVTRTMGQAASVMDYNPIVLATDGGRQGDYLPRMVGPYDVWAIEYGYTVFSGNEGAELEKIAGRVAEHGHEYSTDEDAFGTFSPYAMDPRVNQFDQASDILAYNRERIKVINELWTNMEGKLALPGKGYQDLRRAVGVGMGENFRALGTSSKYVGGIYHHRDHVGDPNGRLPYTVVPAAKQREALEFLREYAFSEKSFVLPAGSFRKLAADRMPQVSTVSLFGFQRLDYPWHDQVLGVQSFVLGRLYHPVTLSRILDNELLFEPNEKAFTMADLFTGLDTAIWSELDGSATKISSLRRNLQREQVDMLIRLVIRPATPQLPNPPPGFTPPPQAPEDATTLARASLTDISKKISRKLAAGTVQDRTTRAHLEETRARIDTALKAQMSKPLG